jgi:hypothetical protein
MNINKHLNRFTIVDRQYKIRQISVETHKTNEQVSRKINQLKIVPQEQKKAA